MKKVIIPALFIASLFASGFDSEDGAPIRQGVHIEWYRTVAPGNPGEAIFVWSDTRFGMRNIFAHKINQAGETLWGETGAIVTDLPGRQEDPVSIIDGNGGVFIAWVDYRFDAEGDIFIQHLDSNGNLTMDENGVALAQVEGKQISINMCTDSLGGVFVTWQDKRGGVDDDLYGTHVSYENNILSPGTGIPIVVEGGNQNAKSIEYAGNNEAFIAWADFREGANADIYGQRMNMNMVMTFADNGIPIANTSDQELKPRVTYINDDQSFVTWKRGDENSRIFYQFVNTEGTLFSEAKPVSEFDAIQTAPRVKRSAIGEVFINWTDLRADTLNGDQFFQKVDINGDTQWSDGIQLDLTDGYDFSARFSAGNDGDLNVVYELGIFPDVEIMFQNIGSDGSYTFTNSINISESDGYQFSPNILGNVETGLYLIYADQRTGSIDLKVQKLESGYAPSWDSGGLIAMEGLDGDIKYTLNFRNGDDDFFLVWEDNRATKKIYGTRITNSETQIENGKQLSFSTISSDNITLPVIIKNESGFYVATFDASSSPRVMRINKLNDQFENLWDSSGVEISPVEDMRNGSLVGIDDGVGCFWSEPRLLTNDIYFQRFDGDGNPLLGENGIELVDSNGDDYLLGVIPTLDNKLLIFWMEEAWPNAVLKYTKIDHDGNIEIGWNPNGNSLSNSYFDARNLQVKVIDDNSGILAVWTHSALEGTSVLPTDIYAQVIDWDGNTLYADGGVIITDADNDQVNFSFDFNENLNRAMLVWEDFRNGQNFEIFGQILNLENGDLVGDPIQFTSVVNDSLHNYNPVISHIMENEFMVIWEDSRGYINEDPLLINGVDLYGSGYNFGSGMTTDVNGIPVCIAYHKQQNVNITHHSGSEFFLDWIDYRSSGKEDLANYYGRIIEKAELLSNDPKCDCPLPTEFSLKPAYPNPFNGIVNFEFAMPAKEAVEFRIYDLTGRVVSDRLILPGFGGNYRVSWNGKNMNGQLAPAGIYFYEFKTNRLIEKGKITYLK